MTTIDCVVFCLFVKISEQSTQQKSKKNLINHDYVN